MTTITYKSLFTTTLMLVASVTAFRAPENPAAIKAPVLTKTTKPVIATTAPTPIVQEEEDGVISNESLAQVGKALASQRFVKSRHATERKQWGVDNDDQDEGVEYWFDSRIHTFGNTGFLGALHAAMAPLSTKVIDMVAYDGQDVRAEVRFKNG